MVVASTDRRASRSARPHELRLLVVDDDETLRKLYVALLKQIDGVDSVAAAADGVEAVELARTTELNIAVLDLNMPGLDGVEAATAMAALQPSLSIALQSSDLDELQYRADGLDFAVFDKLRFDDLASWVTREVARSRAQRPTRMPTRDLSCVRCGYGVVTGSPPPRCPMCNGETDWVDAATGRRPDA
jgi:CheY-like chemotaxis protein